MQLLPARDPHWFLCQILAVTACQKIGTGTSTDQPVVPRHQKFLRRPVTGGSQCGERFIRRRIYGAFQAIMPITHIVLYLYSFGNVKQIIKIYPQILSNFRHFIESNTFNYKEICSMGGSDIAPPGITRFRWRYAFWVTQRPRGVRDRNPSCIR